MICLNELNKSYIIESVNSPLPLRYHWVFNSQMMDFTLAEINYLEENVGPAVTLVIDGAEVTVPGAWHIMIVDRETYTVDMVPVTACAAFEHEAFIFSPGDGKLITSPIRVERYSPKGTCVHPTVEKACAMIHAIAPGISHGKTVQRGVIVGPNDNWRYISGCTVGDILN